MPRIDQDIKLDFKDVLFRPKRSTIKSRQDVSAFAYIIIMESMRNISIFTIIYIQVYNITFTCILHSVLLGVCRVG